jgi:EpsI family protein
MTRRLTSNLTAVAMLLAVAAAWWLTPQPSTDAVPRLADVVPKSFQDWVEINTQLAPVDPTGDRDGVRDTNSPYDDVLMRAYANPRGDVILLALAYGREQHQEVKIHRPDLCYVAQGFKVIKRSRVTFPNEGDPQPATGERMLVQSIGRVEAVSYWIRIGGMYASNAWRTRFYIFRHGLGGHEPDGILVRVSQIVSTPDAALDERYRLQEQFIADLVRAMPAESRRLLTVGPRDSVGSHPQLTGRI